MNRKSDAREGEAQAAQADQAELANRSPRLTQTDLRKLKRAELLEIMLAQSEEIDRLRAQLAEKDRQLQERAIAIEQSGSIAEAALKLTHVFEEAQKAADLYVDNVKRRAAAGQDEAAQADADAPVIADALADDDEPVEAVAPATEPAEYAKPAESTELDKAQPLALQLEKADAPDAADAADAAEAPADDNVRAVPPASETVESSEAEKPETKAEVPEPTEPEEPEAGFEAAKTEVLEVIEAPKHRQKAAFTYTLPTSITAVRHSESPSAEARTDDNLNAAADAATDADDDTGEFPGHGVVYRPASEYPLRGGTAGEFPPQHVGSHAGHMRPSTDAADADQYKPGDGLKAIEDLIQDLKVSGAKHRG